MAVEKYYTYEGMVKKMKMEEEDVYSSVEEESSEEEEESSEEEVDTGPFLQLRDDQPRPRLSELDATYVRKNFNPNNRGYHIHLKTLEKAMSKEVLDRKEEFSRAGFQLPVRNHGKDDLVVCLQCMVGVHGWTKLDDPMYVHAQLRPSCAHVLATQYVSKEEAHAITVKAYETFPPDLTIVSLAFIRRNPPMYRLIESPDVWFDKYCRP